MAYESTLGAGMSFTATSVTPKTAESTVKSDAVIMEGSTAQVQNKKVEATSLENNNGDAMDSQSPEQQKRQLDIAAEKVNEALKLDKKKCEYTYFEDLNRVAIKIKDYETGEVIREVPPEDTLKMVQKMWEIAGLLVDERG